MALEGTPTGGQVLAQGALGGEDLLVIAVMSDGGRV